MLAKLRWFSLIPSLFVISAMAHEPQPQTVRICDESGCAEKPRDSVSFIPRALGNQTTGRRHAELVALASTDPQAAYDLGLRHFRGDGVPQDSYQALKWMRDAASRGYLPAQTAVGRLYLSGLAEMGADPAEAEKWLLMASSKGDKEAGKLLVEAQKAKQSEVAYQRWKEANQEESRNFWEGLYQYRWQWPDDDYERDLHASRTYRR